MRRSPRRPLLALALAIIVLLVVASMPPSSLARPLGPAGAASAGSSGSTGADPSMAAAGEPADGPEIDTEVEREIARTGRARTVVTLNAAHSPARSGDDRQQRAASRSAVRALLASLPSGSAAATGEPDTLPVVAVTIDGQALGALRRSKVVAAVEADTTLRPTSLASSTVVGTPTAVASGWTGAGGTVAVLDSGVDSSHPFLRRGTTSRTIAEACFSTTTTVSLSSCPGGRPMGVGDAPRPGAGQPCDLTLSRMCDHGTSVAGIAVGGDGRTLPSGIAPGASIVSVKIFGHDAADPSRIGASLSDVNLALQWLYNRRADLPGLSAVNLSIAGGRFTGPCTRSSVQAFIHQLATVGIATIVAAGNDGYDDAVGMPACAPDAVAVASMDDATAARSPWSNISPKVALFAPGERITTAHTGGGYLSASGTSVAAPAIAGAWAVVHQRFPDMTVTEELDQLRSNGIGLITDTSIGRYDLPMVRVDLALRPPAGTATENGTLTTVTPARLMDTRALPTIDRLFSDTGAVRGGETRRVRVTGRGYVPSTGVASVSLNVTIADPTEAGYLTVFGADAQRPNASNLNFTPGSLSSNMVLVPVGADGTIAVFNSAGATQVIVDVLGWFPDAGVFRPLAPARLMDTRDLPTIDGLARSTGAFAPGESRALRITGRGGVPATGVGAVALNVTVAGATAAGYVTVHPNGTPTPTASTLDFGPSQIVPNTVIVPVDALGRVRLFNFSGRTDLAVDVMGWFPTSAAFGPLPPARLLDTRALPTIDGRFSGTGAIAGGGRLDLPVTGRGGVPATGVAAVAINVTVDRPTADGFVTVFPAGIALPATSTVNFAAGVTLANATIVPVGADGRISIYNFRGPTDVVVDVLGWFR